MKLNHKLVVTFAAISTIIGQSVSAQNASTVMIKALTSNGADTGTCIANPDGSLGGWVLKTCNKTDPLQQFSFDTKVGNTQGTTMAQKTAAGVKCMAVLSEPTSTMQVNSIVAKSDCNITGSAGKWLLNNKQFVLTDATPSTKTKLCLTANSSSGNTLRLGDCSKPATLTNWEVVKAVP
jgi:hypothetical protein